MIIETERLIKVFGAYRCYEVKPESYAQNVNLDKYNRKPIKKVYNFCI